MKDERFMGEMNVCFCHRSLSKNGPTAICDLSCKEEMYQHDKVLRKVVLPNLVLLFLRLENLLEHSGLQVERARLLLLVS